MEIQQVENDVHDPVAADELQNLLKKKLNEVPGKPFKTRHVTIFRFPAWFHEINKNLCEPRIVSIGPYHHGKESLRAMEEHKLYTLRNFLARKKNVVFEDYLGGMRSLEQQARERYSETVHMKSNEFVMMLLLDGCFILEYLYKRERGPWDPFLSGSISGNGLILDLCLLENQVPFFVIHELFAIQGRCLQTCQGPCPLVQLLYDVRPYDLKMLQFKLPELSCSEIDHLLHLFYIGVVPHAAILQLQVESEQFQVESEQNNHSVTSKPHLCLRGFQFFPWSKIYSKSSNRGSDRNESVTSKPHLCLWGFQFFPWSKIYSKSSNRGSDRNELSFSLRRGEINIPCITELYEAGIKFRRKREACHLLDVLFQNGIMEMPYIPIYDINMAILWNMVAFEQQHCPVKILSSFLGLFDSLINTEKDVAILERSGIFENYFQNSEQATDFFNQFGRIFVLDYSDHHFYDLFRDVKRYSESTCNKYRARLMHDYFSNPWSAISVVAATVVIVLTFIQTYYSAAK